MTCDLTISYGDTEVKADIYSCECLLFVFVQSAELKFF